MTLKMSKTSNYMKIADITSHYKLIEFDKFTHTSIIQYYISRMLPYNTLNLWNFGMCNKNKNKKKNKKKTFKNKMGYNLFAENTIPHLDNEFIPCRNFIKNLLNGEYDDKLIMKYDSRVSRVSRVSKIDDSRYILLTNCLLQVICILGHLQTSNLEYNQELLTPECFHIKILENITFTKFNYSIAGKPINIINMGFAVYLTEFTNATITLHSKFAHSNRQNRIGYQKMFKYSKNVSEVLGQSVMGIELYIFFISLLDSEYMKTYFLAHKLHRTVMSFMPDEFMNIYLQMKFKSLSVDTCYYKMITIFKKIKKIKKELNHIHLPILDVFTFGYLQSLKLTNLYLVEPK